MIDELEKRMFMCIPLIVTSVVLFLSKLPEFIWLVLELSTDIKTKTWVNTLQMFDLENRHCFDTTFDTTCNHEDPRKLTESQSVQGKVSI